MKAEIVMIGTELLLGEIVDTNAAKLAIYLRDIGLDLYYKTTVGDNLDRITEVLDLALERSGVVITSGGVGPTVDDMTRQAVANATGRELVYSDELEAQIAARFRKFGREMAENNKRQAWIPEGAIPIENPVGTAPCFLSDDTRGRGFIISLPGVPRELTHMMENAVIPILVDRMGGVKTTRVRVLRTCAVGESNIDRTIGDLMTSSNPTVGLAAHIGQTDVRIAAKADTEEEAEALIAPMEAQIRERLGVAIYATGKETTVAEAVGQLLRERDLKLVVADTLTDGLLCEELEEAGFADRIASVRDYASLEDALEDLAPDAGDLTPGDIAAFCANSLKEDDAITLAALGPFKGDLTGVAVGGPDGVHQLPHARNYAESDTIRRWMATQCLDWVRRVVLGQLTSPADWK